MISQKAGTTTNNKLLHNINKSKINSLKHIHFWTFLYANSDGFLKSIIENDALVKSILINKKACFFLFARRNNVVTIQSSS